MEFVAKSCKLVLPRRTDAASEIDRICRFSCIIACR